MGRYPWPQVFLFHVLRIAICYPTRRRFHQLVLLAAMAYLAAQIFRTSEVTFPPLITYMVGVTTAFHFGFTLFLLYTEGSFPDHWRRVRDQAFAEPGAQDSDNSPVNFPLSKKLWWMLDIAHSSRMVGYVQEPRCLKPHPPPSRKAFLRETFLKLMVQCLIMDLTGSVSSRSPSFDSRLSHGSTHPLKSFFVAIPLVRHAPYVLAFGLVTAAAVIIPHHIAALLCVGLGHDSPTLWPDVLGNWGDAFTIRKFWGRAWHQQMRPLFSGLGKFISNKFFKFPRGTNRSSYAQLYIAFFLSGVIHFAGDFMANQRVVYHSFKFFLLQALAITVEDFIVYIGKHVLFRRGIKLNPGRADENWADAVARVMGYCWVTLWFCYTLPEWRDKSNGIGFDGAEKLPISRLVRTAWQQWT